MANQLGSRGSGRSAPAGRAEVMLAEARKAFCVMIGFLLVIWVLQIANWASHYALSSQYAIEPRDVARLPDIFAAPFLHWGWSHIEANSGPLFVLGFLAAYNGVWRFAGVTVLIAVTSGLAIWFFQGGSASTVGASGLVFGFFSYVVARGVFDRKLIDVLIGLVTALSYAYILTVAVPGTPGVSWVGHLGGLVGGVAGGWLWRSRKGTAVRPKLEGGAGSGTGAGTGAGVGTGAGPPADSGTRPLPVPADNPRAALHRELGELGL